jgi:hypothetical protein
MNGIGHFDESRHVILIPDAQFDERRDLGGMMNLDLFGEDRSSAAFGLDAPHFGGGGGIAITAAIAVRHLIKSVLGRDRPDRYGFEENIVARIAHWL